MDYIYKQIVECKKCNLHSNVDHKVIASGLFNAPYFILGMCPGKEEFINYEPFVGESGLLLRDCLNLGGIAIPEVYFSNVCRCWPHTGKYPGDTRNVDPEQVHIDSCKNYVYMEIDYIRPKVIIPTGNIPLSILVTNLPGITKCHGQFFETVINEVMYPVVPIYHPSYLIRTKDINREKYKGLYRDYIEDITKISKFIEGPAEPKYIVPQSVGRELGKAWTRW